MSNQAAATFKVRAWDEKPYNESPKLTRASVKYDYEGGLEGEASSECLMVYAEDGSASYVTVDLFTGKLAGMSGSFVLQGNGTYQPSAGIAKWTAFIVPGSGTGDLKGIRGDAEFSAKHTPPGTCTLEYELD
jgi:hypothetical protein